MSDYISKSELVDSIMKNVLITTEEGFELRGEIVDLIKSQPTVDEKEVIRKHFERVVERLKNRKADYEKDYKEYLDGEDLRKAMLLDVAIEIVKEEGGIE